jgi:hypothetical protein
MKNKETVLGFENVTLYLMYTSVTMGEINLSRFKDDNPSWVVKKPDLSDVRVKRLFHPQYLSIISLCTIVSPPILHLQGIDEESIYSVPWPKEHKKTNIYHQLIKEKPKILENKKLQTEFWLFPGGFCTVIIRIDIDGLHSNHNLIALVNGLIDYGVRLKCRFRKTSTLLDIISDYFVKLIIQKKHIKDKTFRYFESYSIIIPEKIEPEFQNAHDYFQAPYSSSLYPLLTRRGESFDINPEVYVRLQKNISVYKSDIAVLNYHNMFIYVNNELHTPTLAYINIVIMLKTMAAMLHHFNIMTYKQLSEFKKIPTSLKNLAFNARQLEETRLKVIQAIDMFRILTDVSAVRAKMIIDTGLAIFIIEPMVISLEHKLQVMDSLLSSNYSLQLQKKLQWLAIIIGFFTLTVTAVSFIGYDRFVKIFQNLFCK